MYTSEEEAYNDGHETGLHWNAEKFKAKAAASNANNLAWMRGWRDGRLAQFQAQAQLGGEPGASFDAV